MKDSHRGSPEAWQLHRQQEERMEKGNTTKKGPTQINPQTLRGYSGRGEPGWLPVPTGSRSAAPPAVGGRSQAAAAPQRRQRRAAHGWPRSAPAPRSPCC